MYKLKMLLTIYIFSLVRIHKTLCS